MHSIVARRVIRTITAGTVAVAAGLVMFAAPTSADAAHSLKAHSLKAHSLNAHSLKVHSSLAHTL